MGRVLTRGVRVAGMEASKSYRTGGQPGHPLARLGARGGSLRSRPVHGESRLVRPENPAVHPRILRLQSAKPGTNGGVGSISTTLMPPGARDAGLPSPVRMGPTLFRAAGTRLKRSTPQLPLIPNGTDGNSRHVGLPELLALAEIGFTSSIALPEPPNARGPVQFSSADSPVWPLFRQTAFQKKVQTARSANCDSQEHRQRLWLQPAGPDQSGSQINSIPFAVAAAASRRSSVARGRPRRNATSR